MLCPSRIARIAPSATTPGTSVSHTPCARFTPPIRSHSAVIARISDCTTRGANSLNPNRPTTTESVRPSNPPQTLPLAYSRPHTSHHTWAHSRLPSHLDSLRSPIPISTETGARYLDSEMGPSCAARSQSPHAARPQSPHADDPLLALALAVAAAVACFTPSS